MNKDNLKRIFGKYIEKFEFMNNQDNNETYKWEVAKKFREAMDDALNGDDETFKVKLAEARVITRNIIDSYTQPFWGLVEISKKEPATVREMFKRLYFDDGGDLKVQERLIEEFFIKSQELVDKYFPGSFRYKQNSHSVSAYLFLYDPDKHYMYKATQAQIFADCIEFYDDWGNGDNINLEVYYKMCDWLVEEIKKCEPLLRTNEDRFINKESVIEDKEKHMLAFDIIYACSVYDLFEGISFSRPNLKEKNIILAKREIAEKKYAEYLNAAEDANTLDDAVLKLEAALENTDEIEYKSFGWGQIQSREGCIIKVVFEECEKNLDVITIFSKGIAKTRTGKCEEIVKKYENILNRKSVIKSRLKFTEKTLEPYKEYIEI